MNIFILILGIILGIGLFFTSLISIFEKEYLAFRRLLYLSFITPIPFLILFIINISIFNLITLIIFSLLTIYFLIPDLKFNKIKYIKPINQLDERNIMFSRNRLVSGSDNFKNYYIQNPEHKTNDDLFRKNPGLLSPEANFYSVFPTEAADANFFVSDHLKKITDQKESPIKNQINQKNVTDFITNWLKCNGAIDVGFGKLEDYHFYSNHGYEPEYGEPINKRHNYAISILVEMDKEMMSTAPNAPVVMESSQQYLFSSVLTVALAKFIQNLGYPAQAHIDGKYDLVAPLVARDCGLGEIGRMGLLISKKLGPRVRIAVVTTNLPVVLNNFRYDPSVDEFCKTCLKCANICPSQAIPFGDKSKIDGVSRWQIDQEKCFNLWTKFGTDCGICMQVCPYSHPNNHFHNIIRFGIKYFPNFRKFAAKMDDFVYGKKPGSSKPQKWTINSP